MTHTAGTNDAHTHTRMHAPQKPIQYSADELKVAEDIERERAAVTAAEAAEAQAQVGAWACRAELAAVVPNRLLVCAAAQVGRVLRRWGVCMWCSPGSYGVNHDNIMV